MKEIRFRAWDKKNKKMLEVHALSPYWIQYQPIMDDGEPSLDIQDVEVMQFTGLLDKNGEEIYEGDILSLEGNMSADDSFGILPNGWSFDEENKFKVCWDEKRLGWGIEAEMTQEEKTAWGEYSEAYLAKYKNHVMCLISNGKSKIIGNIHQNPELLN